MYIWCGIADRWCCFYVLRAILTSHSGHTSCAPPVAPLARLWGHCKKNAEYAPFRAHVMRPTRRAIGAPVGSL